MKRTDFLVRKDDFRECRTVESEVPGPEEGQALLHVERFGLTANNITYATFGEAMSYWDFFPAGEGWGRVPMWGFAEVGESLADGVESGKRVYGYLPPSSHLVVTPGAIDPDGFVDASPHRSALPSAYHRYLVTENDPFYRNDTEDLQILLRPLFYTSFLIDDELADNGLTDRGPVVVSSASSKTSLAAAFMLAQRDGVELVGLTSSRSAEFVEKLELYDRCVTYDDIASLGDGPAVFVDVAGDGEVRRAVHEHYGDDLAWSMAVGATHWEELGVSAGDLPGPVPTLFFAPTRVEKRAAEWGRRGLNDRVVDAWHPFCEWTAGWLELDRGDGFDAVEKAYIEVLEGQVPPDRAKVLSL